MFDLLLQPVIKIAKKIIKIILFILVCYKFKFFKHKYDVNTITGFRINLMKTIPNLNINNFNTL